MLWLKAHEINIKKITFIKYLKFSDAIFLLLISGKTISSGFGKLFFLTIVLPIQGSRIPQDRY